MLNSFLYIYCSNESPVNVYFDNLQVVHTKGPLVETNEYYPFGLLAAGISYKAFSDLENYLKLSGNELQSGEFEIGSGLELYDFNARMYDAQIGRFQSPDPLSILMTSWSSYSYSFNNPVNYTDPTGLYPDDGYGDDDVLDPVSEGCYCSRPGAEILYTEREPDMHAHDEFDDRDLFYFDEKYFENDDQIEKDFANLLSENKYYEAVELIINSYPEMMGQTPKNHIFEVTEKGDQGRHVTQYVLSTDGSYTRFAAGILKLYQGGYSSFGAQV